MRKWKNPRIPSCPRDPSRRLHPLPEPSSIPLEEETATAAYTSSSNREEIDWQSDQRDRSDSPLIVNEGLEIEPSDEEEVSFDSLSETSSEASVAMARPQIKFLSPPIFKGNPDEDALDWVDRYERTGTYNGWGKANLRENFNMFLDGAARKWYFCTPLPAEWDDQPARPDPNNAGVTLPAVIGLKTRFLQEFQQENFSMFQEAKLRNRTQGIEEPTSSYYYDILDMCRVVNPAMSESAKLEYLF